MGLHYCCARCGYSPDETDLEAGRRNRLMFAEAARRVGHSESWVKARVRQGIIRTVNYAGRTYIDGSSVDQLLATSPFPSEVEQQIEACEERHRAGDPNAGFELLILRDRQQRESDDDERRRLGGYTVAEVARSSMPIRDEPDRTSAARELLDRFGGR